MADEKETDIPPENMDFSSLIDAIEEDDDELFTELDINALEQEEVQRKAEQQHPPEEINLMDAMSSAPQGVITEDDLKAIEQEQQEDKEAAFYRDGGEYLPSDVRETLKVELEKKASEELAEKIERNPLEIFTEQDLKNLEQEQKGTGNTLDANALQDALYNNQSIIGDPPVHIGETLDSDTINALRGNTNEAQEPPPPPPPTEEVQEEEQEEPQSITAQTEHLNATLGSHPFAPEKNDREFDPNAIRTANEDPMLAFMELLKTAGDEATDVAFDKAIFQLNQVSASMDAKTFSLEKPTSNNIVTDTGSTEVSADDIVDGLSYWLVYANRMAKKANVGDTNLLNNDIISLSVAEHKMHRKAYLGERDQNAENWDFTLPIKGKTNNSEQEQNKEPRITKAKNAFHMAVTAITLGRYGKKVFEPERRSKTVIFPNLLKEGKEAAKTGNMDELKDFVSKTDAIMEELETKVASRLGLPEEYTVEDLQKKAIDTDNDEVKACVDCILAYTRGSLIAEKKFLEEDLVSSHETLKQEACRRDSLMKAGGIDKDILRFNTNLNSPRDLIRSAATRAEAEGGLDSKNGFKAFKDTIPTFGDGKHKLSDKELKELGKLSIKTDQDIKTISEGRTEGIRIAEERIQEITTAYFPEAENLQQGIKAHEEQLNETAYQLSKQGRREAVEKIADDYKNTEPEVQDTILDALANQQDR